MLGVSQALRVRNPEITFDFSIWTAIAFLAGFSSLFAYLRLVLSCGKRTPSAFRYGGLVVLGLMTLAALFYPFRSLRLDQLAQPFAGIGAALCFIAAGLTMVYRTVLAAGREEERQEAEERRSATMATQAQEQPTGKELPYENRGS